MNRRRHRDAGFAAPILLLLSGAAGSLALTLLVAQGTRQQWAAANQARVQGREWCLGAARLTPGTTVDLPPWTVARQADGSLEARGPRGTYRITADRRETWKPR